MIDDDGAVLPEPTPKEWLAESKKAVFAFFATAIVAYFRRIGLQLDETEVADVLASLIGALITAAVVWWTRNRDKWLRGTQREKL